MGFDVRVIKNDNFKPAFDSFRVKTLEAAGALLVDDLAKNTHVITGLLRNSWQWRTAFSSSGFGSDPGKKGEIFQPDEELKRPLPDDTVFYGSPVIYAQAYNKKFAIMEKVSDNNVTKIQKLATRIAGSEFK